MENNTFCFRCKENYENPLTLSCKHNICPRCLCRQILKKFLLDLPEKDTLTFTCKCKNGTLGLNLIKIGEIIKNNLESSFIKCKKHNSEAIKFCKECKNYMCETCFNAHEQLFSGHNISDVNEQISQNLINTVCDIHNKEYAYYCKNCKICLCNACVHDKEIISSHKEHVVESYKNIINLINEQINKLQFGNYESFIEYMKKMEDEFNNVFNENLNKTVQSLESIISVLSKTLDDFKKKMEIKMNKKNLVMSILKKVYEIYYDDIKRVKDGYKNISTLKFLSKEYSEFSNISFRSDLDLIVNKLEKIKGALEKEDVNNIIRISYAYFAKKELNLTTTIKDEIKEPVTDIIELKEGRIIVASEDSLIRIYDEKGSILFTLKGHSNGVRSLCQMKDGKLASGSSDKTIRIWDLKQNKTINILKEHSNPIISLNILHNDKLASCSFRDIIIYDDKLKPQYILQDHSNWVRNIIQLDKLKSCSISDDGSIKIYDKHFRVLNSFKDHNCPVLSVCLLRDGRLVTGDKKGKIIIWNKSLTNTQELKQHNLGILSIKQIKDGRICTASIDKTIKIWDIDFKGLFVFKNHSAPVNCLCILKDGGLASGGADAVINIWR